MKTLVVPALAAALLMLAACEGRVETESRSVAADSALLLSDRTGEIAGDKTMTADLMRRSFEKGTFDDALSLALQDSALAAEVVAVLRADPRYAGLLENNSSDAPQPLLSSSTAKTSTAQNKPAQKGTVRSSTQGSTNRDPIDKAEQTMQKTNEKLDQAARVRDQIEEARRKAEGILKPR